MCLEVDRDANFSISKEDRGYEIEFIEIRECFMCSMCFFPQDRT